MGAPGYRAVLSQRGTTARFLIAAVALLNSGCLIHRGPSDESSRFRPRFFSSRWAMDDPDYYVKYRKPYGRNKFPRMAKQMVDARHVAGKSGWSLGASVSDDPVAVTAKAGGFTYPTPWLEFHGGLQGAVQEGEQDLMVGLGGGARLQTPTRIAPFVGVGGFGGLGFFHEVSNNFNDEFEEDETVALFSVYPEAGIHYWLGSHFRVTGSAGYRVTTAGRARDHLFYGVSLSWLTGADSPRQRTREVPMDADTRDQWLNGYDDGPSRLPPVGAMGDAPYPNSPPQPPPYPTPVQPQTQQPSPTTAPASSPQPPPYPTPVG